MGWFRRFWTRIRHAPARRPAWVSPQFLGIFLALALAAGALAYFALPREGSPPGPAGGTDRAASDSSAPGRTITEFVGSTYGEVLMRTGGLLTCAPDCGANAEFESWLGKHPGVTILAKTPVFEHGVLLGFQVTYQEASK